MAYETTTIDPMKSWGEICAVVYAHGCEGTSYSEIPTKGFEVQFIKSTTLGDSPRKTMVRIPVFFKFPDKATPKMREQEIRTKWRSLYYYIKAVFDAIDKGIVTYEQVFLADMVMSLPNGEQSRVIDAMLPDQATGGVDLQHLLPSPKASNGTITQDAEYRILPGGP